MKDRMGEALPKVLILGTGAMAKLFGGRLARHGLAKVTLAGRWRDAVVSMEAEGIVVEEPQAKEKPQAKGGLQVETDPRPGEESGLESERSDFVARVDSVLLGDTADSIIPDALPAAAFDLVLILVKSHQTEAIAPVAAYAVAPHGRILTLQNGVGNREALAAAATNPSLVSAGVTTAGATGLGPNRVRAGGPGMTVLGASSSEKDLDRFSMQSIAKMFRAAGFETETASDIDALLWRKLVVNCAINPLTALNDIPNGALLEDESLRSQMGQAAREVVAVADALGVQLGAGFDPVAAAESVAHKTRGNRSSMLQDMDRGAKTEIDAIAGAVVKEGRRLGVPTPVNARLWAAVLEREEGASSESGVSRKSGAGRASGGSRLTRQPSESQAQRPIASVEAST
jgi:2-dehydropantoate 2-reductase